MLGPELGSQFNAAYDITALGNFPLTQLLMLANNYTLPAKSAFHLFKDDKIMTGWNGLVISALAKGVQVLAEPTYLTAAESAIDFINSGLS